MQQRGENRGNETSCAAMDRHKEVVDAWVRNRLRGYTGESVGLGEPLSKMLGESGTTA